MLARVACCALSIAAASAILSSAAFAATRVCPRLEIYGAAAPAQAPSAPAGCVLWLGAGPGASAEADGALVLTPEDFAAGRIERGSAATVIGRVLVLGIGSGFAGDGGASAGPDDVFRTRGEPALARAREALAKRAAAQAAAGESAAGESAALESQAPESGTAPEPALALLAKGGTSEEPLCSSTLHGLLALFDVRRVVVPASGDRSQVHCGGRLVELARGERLVLDRGGVVSEGPAGRAVLEPSDLDVERYLLEADVVEMTDAERGITKPLKVVLDRGGDRRRALFKPIDLRKEGRYKERDFRTEMIFEDSFRFEIAAYRLDRALGLDMTPVAVIREVKGQRGALIEWVDDALTEPDRGEKRLAPRDPRLLVVQREAMRVFDALILNTDRTTYNMLYTISDWRLHAIDHSRSFRRADSLSPEYGKDMPLRITMHLVEELRGLSRESVEAVIGDMVDKIQVRAILKRRDEILERVEADRKRYGDAIVFADGHGAIAAH